MFTLKDTGETMSYDQVRQYLMENPDIWLGAKEGKEVAMPKGEKPSAMPGNTNADIANRIRNKKQKGALSAIDFGISVTIYNGALDFMASQVEKGTKLGNAIANTIKWIDEKMAGAKWNKGAFGKYMNDTYSVTLPNGREVEVVRDDSKETAEVINGWYSDLEQKILDSKEDKLPAATWAKRLKSKEDEDVWTGVRGFLESKKPSEQVSKKELRDWMKDNRVEISEVVKQDRYDEYRKKEDEALKKASKLERQARELEEDAYDIEDEATKKKMLAEANDLFEEAKNSRLEAEGIWYDYDTAGKEYKFSQYQLEGDKENYKEVLVTLPSKEVNPEISGKKYYENFLRKGGDKSWEELSNKERSDIISNVPDFGKKEDAKFRSTHFDEPNILVHLRMNTRTDANGNKVLFLEEVQSDWGQKGKKEGFATGEKVGNFSSYIKDNLKLNWSDEKISKEFNNRDSKEYKEWDRILSQQTKIPSAPFVTDTNSWTKLGLKVALREAVKQGEQMQRKAFEKLVDEKMDWVEARMKKLGKLEVECP
jgi:hypothetical protein